MRLLLLCIHITRVRRADYCRVSELRNSNVVGMPIRAVMRERDDHMRFDPPNVRNDSFDRLS